MEDTKSDFPHHRSSLAQQRLILPRQCPLPLTENGSIIMSMVP